MPRSPEVVTGMRPPRQTLADQANAKSAQAAVVAPVARALPKEGTVYESAYLKYRIQITSPDQTKDSATGRVQDRRPLVAQFEDGLWVNNHRNPEMRAQIDKWLQENPRFGLGRDFWLASDAIAKAQEAAAVSVQDTIRSLPPDLTRQILQDMVASGELDIQLPARKKPNETQPEV